MQLNHNNVEGRGAPEGDRTDPLVSPGAALERVEQVRLYPGAVLERVELFGAEGLSSRFLRLSVHEPGPLVTLLQTLLPGLPEAASGLRDLLIREGEAFCAALDAPAATLAELAADVTAGPGLRTRDILEMLGSLSAVLALSAAQGFVWAEPDMRLVGFHHPPEDGVPATLLERRAVLLDWAGLSPGDEHAAAASFAAFALELARSLAEDARKRLPGFLAAGIERLCGELEALIDLPGLTYAKLASAVERMEMRYGIHGATDTGRKRQANEDAFLTFELHQQSLSGVRFTLAAVADGMGGHASGEVASSLALDLLRQQLAMNLLRPRTRPLNPDELAAGIAQAVPLISEAIVSRAQMDAELEGMGTTLCGLALLRSASTQGSARGGATALFNVGDSRAYLVHAGGLSRLSLDHSHVQELLDVGEVTPEEAFSHPYKNVITRCLGGGSGTSGHPDVVPFDPGPGELVLLCSDGLSDALRDREIEAVIGSTRVPAGGGGAPVSGGDSAGATSVMSSQVEPAALARALIDAANAAGGPDNITVVMLWCM